MPITPNHTIHADHHHFQWDNAIPPVATVAPGESVEFRIADSGGGQITPATSPDDLRGLDFQRINPVTGPVRVDGAAPGDALKVTILDFTPTGWGWTANIPGFGLLADQFPEPALRFWSYDTNQSPASLDGLGGQVPLKPSTGSIGSAPSAPGPHDILPPRRVGGTMNIRDISNGTILYLPVEVPGAIFSVGDVHAAQGDGEVCGTAIETAMDVAVSIDLIKDARLPFPRFEVPGPVSRHLDEDGYLVTTGIGRNLMQCAKDAVSGMIHLLCGTYDAAAIDAYMLCSVCGDLRISEIVDRPNWVVSFYFPKSVLA